MTTCLVALLTVDGVSKYLSVEALEVANRILGLLLAALAMETIVNGAGDLVKQLLNQLQAMGMIG